MNNQNTLINEILSFVDPEQDIINKINRIIKTHIKIFPSLTEKENISSIRKCQILWLTLVYLMIYYVILNAIHI